MNNRERGPRLIAGVVLFGASMLPGVAHAKDSQATIGNEPITIPAQDGQVELSPGREFEIGTNPVIWREPNGEVVMPQAVVDQINDTVVDKDMHVSSLWVVDRGNFLRFIPGAPLSVNSRPDSLLEVFPNTILLVSIEKEADERAVLERDLKRLNEVMKIVLADVPIERIKDRIPVNPDDLNEGFIDAGTRCTYFPNEKRGRPTLLLREKGIATQVDEIEEGAHAIDCLDNGSFDSSLLDNPEVDSKERDWLLATSGKEHAWTQWVFNHPGMAIVLIQRLVAEKALVE